jgi:DNA-binding transcriptional MerR regulator
VTLLTIGAFSRASRLSPKALRIYDELGLLTPARTDPVTGYRLYDPAQLDRARLVAWLRRLGMPLDRVKVVCELPARSAAGEVAAFWAESEAEAERRRDLAAFVVGFLSGGDDQMFEVQVRDVPARTLLSRKQNVTSGELQEFATELVIRIGGACVPSLPGIDGAPFLVYHGEVDDDSDGPVEWCRPVPADQGAAIAAGFGDLELRTEAAHRLAYVRLTKSQTGPAGGLRAFRSLQQWAAAHGVEPAGPPRQVFLADPRTAAGGDPVCEIGAVLTA